MKTSIIFLVVALIVATLSGCDPQVSLKQFEEFEGSWKVVSVTVKNRTGAGNIALSDTTFSPPGEFQFEVCPEKTECPMRETLSDSIPVERTYQLAPRRYEDKIIISNQLPTSGFPVPFGIDGEYSYEFDGSDALLLKIIGGSPTYAQRYRGQALDINLLRKE